MTGLAAVLALAALIIKLIDFIRYLAGRDINGAATQLLVWVLGVFAVWLLSKSSYAGQIGVGSRSLAALRGWALIVYGLVVSSVASIIKDQIKSFDNSQSAAVPPLLRRARMRQ